MTLRNLHIVLLLTAIVATLSAQVLADPLANEVAKFDQQPLQNAPPLGAPYPGHDELSTALLDPSGAFWRGTYMADDFADTVSTPVVHVQWWGSYMQSPVAPTPIQHFLIAFESDVPAVPPSTANPLGTPSHPGSVLSAQIVTPGVLAPASGTFTETPVTDPGSPDGNLFKYNAELSNPFPEQANTVYWLKIVALVDPNAQGPLQWGWHDRDWTISDALASVPAAVVPGEGVIGFVGGVPVNHFQDDAVQGLLDISTSLLVTQHTFVSQNYVSPWDGPGGLAGAPGIDNFSKDLAFVLYTTTTPEPSTFILLGFGAAGLVLARRRKWRRAA